MSTSSSSTPVVFLSPGRGAWTRTGGLLAIRPGSTSRTGYYRDASAGEARVGSAWPTGRDSTHHAYVVHLGVKAIQQLLKLPEDGIWGPASTRGASAFQRENRLTPDGIVGPSTMFELLKPHLILAADHAQIPAWVLGGLIGNESNFDPAAVGDNGLDHGLAQINLGQHRVTVEMALDVYFAFTWSATDLRRIHDRWVGQLPEGVDVWDIAIANHNSPALSRRWAQTGSAPVVDGRAFQISEYVQSVHDHPAAKALAV